MKESIIIAIFLLGPVLVIGLACMAVLAAFRFGVKILARLFTLSS